MYADAMKTLEQNLDRRVVIPADSVALNPSWESDWGRAIFSLVQRAAQEGKTVTVEVDEKMLTPQQAADRADVSRMTIQRRIEDGTIQATKRGSHWRIPESEIRRFRRAMMAEAAQGMANDF